MAAGRAELVYVKGPQAGQRASLMSAIVTVGRGQQADVQLTEEHVSRKHFQLTLTQDGWVFENLSTLRSRVNGKKCKAGKKIILDTGDVIAVGAKTELLFVATGDDTEAALIAYRQSGARKGKSRSASAAPAVAVTPPDQQLEAGEDQQPGDNELSEGAEPPAAPEDEEEEGELKPEEIAALEQKAKYKKYGTVFGVYIGVLVVLGVVFASLFDRPTRRERSRPALLKKAQIDDFINVKLHRDRNAVEARAALDKAFLALERTNEIDYLYRAVYWFKLSRAYGKVLNTEEERHFGNASRRLTKQVQEKYFNAYAFERDHKYLTANVIFRELLDMLPSMGRREEKNELRENIIAHVAYITRLSSANKRR